MSEQPSQVRVYFPALAIIDGHQYNIENWSIGGLQITGFNQRVKVSDYLPIEFQLNFQDDINISFNTTIEVVWFSPGKQRLGASFVDLKENEKTLLSYLINKFVSKETVVTNNGKVSQSSSKENKTEQKIVVDLRSPKFLISAIAYLTIGLILIFYTLSTLGESITQMEIKSAVISKSIESIISTNWGTISKIYAQEGMTC